MFANSKWKDSVLSLLTLLLFGTIFLPLLKAQQPTEASSASLNYKQLGAAMMAYAADHSDQLPLGYSYNNASQLWRHSSYCIVPEGWLAGRETEPRRTEDASQWANATRIYYKDLRALSIPPFPKVPRSGVDYSTALGPRQAVGTSFNGLLHNYNVAAVAVPSRLMLLWDGLGRANVDGFSVTSPALYCPLSNAPCRYRPNGDPQGGFSRPGGVVYAPPGMMPASVGEGNFLSVDLTLTRQAMKASLTGTSSGGDYYTDPWSYDANGAPTAYWQDGFYPITFKPDNTFN